MSGNRGFVSIIFLSMPVRGWLHNLSWLEMPLLGGRRYFMLWFWQAHLRISDRDCPVLCNTPRSFLIFLLVHYRTIICTILRPPNHSAAPARLFSRK